MDLGTVIKNTRKKKSMTQNELASLCGITQTYLSQIEGNRKEPNLSILKVISEQLEIPLPILFFLSITEEDVDPKKRKSFENITPSIKSLVNELFAI